MELLFLCTILMALVSYCSMALSKPAHTLIDELAFDQEGTIAQSEASIIELSERELIRLATA